MLILNLLLFQYNMFPVQIGGVPFFEYDEKKA